MTVPSRETSTASRLRVLEEQLQRDREVRVPHLAEILGVSAVTIRRYLNILEKKGIAERTHGGAVLVETSFTQPKYLERQANNHAEKVAIAAVAAKMVPHDGVVILGGGTTTLQLMSHLCNRANLTILTPNLSAASLTRDGGAAVVVLGGVVRGQDCALVGEIARMALRTRYADVAVIGTDGITSNVGLTSHDEQERELVEIMLNRTRGPKICVADHNKIGRVSPHLAAPLGSISDLVTDSQSNTDDLTAFEAAGLHVHIAKI